MSEVTEQEAREASSTHEECSRKFFAGELFGIKAHDDFSRSGTTLIEFARQELSRRDAERAEREKPITAEWLRSIGAYRESDYGGDEGYYTVDIDDDEWLSICEDGYVTTIVIADGRKQLSRKFETRGQILDLLKALRGGT